VALVWQCVAFILPCIAKYFTFFHLLRISHYICTVYTVCLFDFKGIFICANETFNDVRADCKIIRLISNNLLKKLLSMEKMTFEDMQKTHAEIIFLVGVENVCFILFEE
jgi:hypothetical protein